MPTTSEFTSDGFLKWLKKNQPFSTAPSSEIVTTSNTTITGLTGCDIISFVDTIGEYEVEVLVQNFVAAAFMAKNITSIDVIDNTSFLINSQDEVAVTLVFINQEEMLAGFTRVETICNNIEVLPCIPIAVIPSFDFEAISLSGLFHTDIQIISTTEFVVDWGDGTITVYSSGVVNLLHTYDSLFTGFIKIISGYEGITSISEHISQTPLPTIIIQTSQLTKLINLLYLDLETGFLTGNVSDLPGTMTYIKTKHNNLIGNVAFLPSTLQTLDIEGTNTLTGLTQNLPTTLISFTLKGGNTLTGDVVGLPTGLVIFVVYGNNTLLGDISDLPSNLVTCTIFGLNTITGDVANVPQFGIDIQGHNTIFGNIDNVPSTVVTLSIGGHTSITGDIALLPAGLSFFEIGGNNGVYGDIAFMPPNIFYFGVVSTNGTLTYTPGVRTWRSSMDTVIIDPAITPLTSTMIDNILIELAAQVTSWFPLTETLYVRLQGVNPPRTAASDAAVATIQALGPLVLTN